MRNVRVLMLAVLLPLMAGLIAGHLTAEPAQAATNRAYYRVTHTDTGGNNVKVADGYTVEYRLYHKDNGWGSWVSKTNTGTIVLTCSSTTQAYRWEYVTDDFDDAIYTSVEWRATVTSGYSGNRCSDSASKSYGATETLNKLTDPPPVEWTAGELLGTLHTGGQRWANVSSTPASSS